MFDVSGIDIPRQPGIYIMKDGAGQIIYIGKAKELRRRVRSYFNRTQDYKTTRLVESIGEIEFVLTDTEQEAYILESGMIKRHRPKFNIELKDQERYTYLRVTDEEYPRLVVARRTRDGRFIGKGDVYGPFVHGSSKLLTIGTLRKTFKVRICKTLPRRVCLEYHLGNCEGPCEFEWAQEKYAGHVRDLKEVLQDKNQAGAFADKLKEEMAVAANLRQFERAREIRDTLARLGSLRAEQKMARPAGSDEEFFAIRVRDGEATVMNFRMASGVIRDSDKFFFSVMGDNNFSNFLYQYYSTHPVPEVIVVSEKPENLVVLEELLSEQSGRQVRIVEPSTAVRRDMIKLLLKNVDLVVAKSVEAGISELQEALGLAGPPRIIECFDISNHGDEYAVGSMSRFVDGRPDKSGYRRFRIRGVTGRDDFAMISEVVGRRYSRLVREDGKMPDLVLVDGGKGQLASAVEALEAAGIRLPCASLAKENEEVFVPGRSRPIVISPRRQSLKILQYARDESHRFGVAYNRAIRRSRLKLEK